MSWESFGESKLIPPWNCPRVCLFRSCLSRVRQHYPLFFNFYSVVFFLRFLMIFLDFPEFHWNGIFSTISPKNAVFTGCIILLLSPNLYLVWIFFFILSQDTTSAHVHVNFFFSQHACMTSLNCYPDRLSGTFLPCVIPACSTPGSFILVPPDGVANIFIFHPAQNNFAIILV